MLKDKRLLNLDFFEELDNKAAEKLNGGNDKSLAAELLAPASTSICKNNSCVVITDQDEMLLQCPNGSQVALKNTFAQSLINAGVNLVDAFC